MPAGDSPWKEAIDRHFPPFLAFFAPSIHSEIDWRQDYEALEQEMHKLLPEALTGKRIADKLVKLITHSGDARIVHVEVQGDREDEFERRMEVYNYRAWDRFGLPVVSVAVLTDDDPRWRPSEYVFSLWGCERRLKFVAVKVLDWSGREAEVEAHPNPFALFVLAHLKSIQTRNDIEERQRAKLGLILKLHERKLDADDLRRWYCWFDWLLPLPKERDVEVLNAIIRFEEGKKMPYISFAERHGMERGERIGKAEGLRKGIEALLRVKFGQQGAELLSSLQTLDDSARLEALLQTAEQAATLEEVRKLLPAASDPTA
jgi:hypothetical protein